MDGLLDNLEFDAYIDNRGTLGDLRGLVAAAMNDEIQRRKYGVRF